MKDVNTLLVEGNVYTMDPAHPHATAVAIRDGRVQAVGDVELRDLAGPGTQIVDLQGRCVVPGLTDAHIHFAAFALALQQIDLAGVPSLDRMVERVAERARRTPPGEWVRGRGWDQEIWPSRRFPSAADLDRPAPDHPVALTAKSGHALVANTRALERAGITAETPDPPGGRIERDESGHPTGLLLEEGMRLIQAVLPQPDAEEIAAALPSAFKQAWRLGLTAVHDMAAPVGEEDIAIFDAYQELHDRGELGVRVVKYFYHEVLDHALSLERRINLEDDRLRIGGIKAFVDGALGPRTAAMLEPYVGEPENRGILTIERGALERVARQAANGDLPMAIHAIGDRANRMVLEVLEKTPGSLRHRIEHAQLLHPDDIDRLAEAGIVTSMQPIHATQDAPMVDRYWGERADTAYAWRSLLEAGTVLAFGSDCPVEDLNPLLGIHAAVTRARPDGYGGPEGWHPEQRLTVEEAVRAYTWGAAYAAGMEERLGSLSPGRWADLVVLEGDIFTAEPDDIATTQVLGTMIGGEWAIQP